MQSRDAEKLCKQLMSDHGLIGWKFVWIQSGRTFGRCWYKRRVIELSLSLVQANSVEQVKDTILHEIAHALAGHKAGHGILWKMVAARIGAKPTACFTFSEVEPQIGTGFVGVCKCPGKQFREKATLGIPYICRKCKSTFYYKKR